MGAEILGAVTARRFLDTYWQREPLLVRSALGEIADLPDGDTLAWLACEDDADARLVLAPGAGEPGWRCELGPFEPERFAHLPGRGWTLLVQGVDRRVPEVAALLDAFGFLPRWRLDDVMVSYAADGGGVGPHFDHYDVFLVQAAGTRRWQLGGRCDARTPLADHPDLRLLERFEPTVEHRLEAGDMLYLPAGIAHEGTAVGDGCITCSVGFRAPSRGEVVQAAADALATRLTDDERFRDTAASLDPDPYRINDAVADILAAMWSRLDEGDVRAALLRGFGERVTEPRDPDGIGPLADPDEAMRRLGGAGTRDGAAVTLRHHPASRLAYRLIGAGGGAQGDAELFVDGEAHACSARFARAVCARAVTGDDLASPRDRRLLGTLIEQGSVYLPD